MPGPGRIRTSGGLDLAVAEHGDPARPTVVLLHGYPDTKEVWAPVARHLAERHRLHVVRYDVRGHGHSATPRPLRGGFTLDKLTDDFLAVADTFSPHAPVHLAGHDWGSVQGWEFTTSPRTRGRVASFTSLSGPCLDHLGHWIRHRLAHPGPRHLAQLLSQSAKSWYIYALHTPRLPELLWHGPLGRRWPAILRHVEGVPDAPAPTLADDASHGAWLYRDNVRPRLRNPRPDAFAHAPVQLVVPTHDRFLSEYLYDGVDQWTTTLEYRRIPARHWLPLTHPGRLSAWIGEFVHAHEP